MTRFADSLATVTLIMSLAIAAAPAVAAEGAGAPAPGWYREHNDFLARDGGVFHADNSAYRSEQEPWDAFGLTWERGPSRHTLRGRLFGLRNGEDVATFWEFFVFWHPMEAKAFMYQVGLDGTIGVGTLEPPGVDGYQRSEQVFYRPDGTSFRVTHVVRNHGDTHETSSLDWIDGAWKPRRAYVWKRKKLETTPSAAGGTSRP